MSMSTGSINSSGERELMSDINITPLADAMLVLLIIFLITVPVIIQTVPVELPNVANIPTTTKPENVSLSVDAECNVYWGVTKLESNTALRERGGSYLLAQVDKQKAAGKPIELPEVHVRGDRRTEYRCIGGVIFAMQRAGYQKVGFISEPPIHVVSR